MSTTTRTPYAKTGDYVAQDTRGAYAELSTAAKRKQSPLASLQKVAHAFLNWDDSAGAAERRELQTFADMPLNSNNVTWPTEPAFRGAFRRALTAAAADNETEGKKFEPRNMAIRAAFFRAIAGGAAETDIKAVTGDLSEINDET